MAYDVKFVPYARAYPSVESEIRYAVLPDLTFAKLSSFSVYSQITVTAVAAEENRRGRWSARRERRCC